MAQRRAGEEPAAVWVSVDELVPWDNNPRRNAEAVPEVAASIKRFGFASPIIARKADGMVIAGHTRLEAARSLGLTSVPVRYMDLDPSDARLLALADNRTGEIAEWDRDLLSQVLEDLDIGEATAGLGFSEEELRSLSQWLPEVDADALSDDLSDLRGESEYAIVRISVRKEEQQRIFDAADAFTTEGGKAERIGQLVLHLIEQAQQ